MPEGCLIIAKERGYSRFYRILDGKRMYLGKSESGIICALVKKQYEERTLAAVLDQKKVLTSCLQIIQGSYDGIESAYSAMDEDIRKYVRKDISTDDGFAEKWAEEKYAAAKRTDKHVIETMGKEMVRSKSEALIADRLFTAGIPYRYEQLLMLDIRDNLFYYPDFTILNKRTRKVIYWEHLGLLGDKKYCLDNLNKIDIYMRFGIVPGKNLILTYECEGKPLSTASVNMLIKEFLV